MNRPPKKKPVRVESEPVGKGEHDVIMAAIGSPHEGDGQEHAEIMMEITGHD